MKTVYTNVDIRIELDGMIFHALNLVSEQFRNPVPRHSHGSSSYEIHYISSGKGTVVINNQSYKIVPNTLYITGPHVEHEQIPDMQDPMVEYCIYFQLQGSCAVPAGDSIAFKFMEKSIWFGTDTQKTGELIRQIFAELEHRYLGYMVEVESLLKSCIVKIVRNYENNQPSRIHFSRPNLEDSKYIITEECFLYRYAELTLDALAAELSLSVRHTERFLKDNYGKTFTQKKTEARMSAAKIYLRDKRISISEIADRLNYSTSQHFSYAFKQYYGMSPTEYRNRRNQQRHN